MKRLLLAAAAAVAISGCATPPPGAKPAEEIPTHVYDAEHVRMQLMPGPCADARSLLMAARGGADHLPRWRAIRSTWLERGGAWGDYAGCWIELSAEEASAPGEVLVLVFEDGASYMLLKSEFLAQGRRGGGT